MAGIGFEIRKILKKNTLLSVFEAYGYAGLIGSGPWLLSIIALMLIGILSLGVVLPKVLIIQFLTLITYMMAASLILTGGLQLLLTRFVADLFFQKKDEQVLPNLLGAQLVTTLAALLIGLAVWPILPLPVVTKIIILGAFVSLCNQWLGAIFLSGMKEYRLILVTMLSGYSFMVLLAFLLRDWQIDGLFFAFFAGEALLFFSFLFMIIRRYPGGKLISFDFLNNKKVYYSLFFCGLFYNIGVWADKIIFWYSPATSVQIIGTLRASPIYDLPIFLAYLTIIPGMAVFLVRMETDFVEQYDRFYTAIRGGSSLEEIFYLKDKMVQTAQGGLYDIFKIQGITIACLLLWGEQILTFIGIDPNYKTLLFIDVVGVGVQVIFLSILNILFYLDKRATVLFLSGLFLFINIVFTIASIALGPQFYGYGFALSTIITSVIGLYWLSKQFEELEYETFMLQ